MSILNKVSERLDLLIIACLMLNFLNLVHSYFSKIDKNELTVTTIKSVVLDGNSEKDLLAFKRSNCKRGLNSLFEGAIDQDLLCDSYIEKVKEEGFDQDAPEKIFVKMRSPNICAANLKYSDGSERVWDIDISEAASKHYATCLYDINERVVY